MDLLVQGIVTGVLIGGLYALMSLGISLSWGALKIINLAHFSFVLLSAYLVYQLATTFGLNPLLMVFVVVPLFFLLGVLMQLFFHRFEVDEFKSLIVTFGVFIILQSLIQTIWSADFRRIGSEVNVFEGGSLRLGGITFPYPVLLAFVFAVAIAVVMSLVLSRTYFGKAVRAVAQDTEMARAFGVDSSRVAVVLSGVSAAISALAGVFIAIGQALFPGLAVSWFGIVFSVVILGGLGNTVGALTAGVIVGVAGGAASVIWGPISAPGSSHLPDRGMTARARVLVGFAVAGIALFFVPALQEALDLPPFHLIFLFTVFFWISQASSWNVLTGFSGYFSFGQGAWYGIGVYTVAVLTGKHGWSFVAAVPMAGLFALIGGLALGLVVFRLRRLSGEIFALTTLAIAFVLAALARLTPAIDGGTGIFMTGTPIPEFLGDFNTAMYRMALVVMLLTVLAAYLTHDSRLGWGLFSIRDDEAVAGGLGVPVFRYKMSAVGINALFAGLMGGIWSLQIGFVTVDEVFNIRVPLFVILMSVLGGLSHWMGPVVGAVIIYTLSNRLNSAGLTDINQIIIGSLLVILALAVKEGIYVRMRDRWVTTLVSLGLVLGVATVFDLTGSLISDFAIAMVLTVAVVMVPNRVWDRVRGGKRHDDGEGPPGELEAIAEEGP